MKRFLVVVMMFSGVAAPVFSQSASENQSADNAAIIRTCRVRAPIHFLDFDSATKNNQCIEHYTHSPELTALARLSIEEQDAIERACLGASYQGASAYRECRRQQILTATNPPSPPTIAAAQKPEPITAAPSLLNMLPYNEQVVVEHACTYLNENLAAYRECIQEQIDAAKSGKSLPLHHNALGDWLRNYGLALLSGTALLIVVLMLRDRHRSRAHHLEVAATTAAATEWARKYPPPNPAYYSPFASKDFKESNAFGDGGAASADEVHLGMSGADAFGPEPELEE